MTENQLYGGNATKSSGAWYVVNIPQSITQNQTFNNNTILLLGSGGGYTTFSSGNSSVSNYTLTFPAVTDTVMTLNANQTLGGTITIAEGDLILSNSGGGSTTLGTANLSSSNYTATFPANTGTIAELNLAQTWTSAQTFTNSDILLLGSSTGYTTFTSGNSSGTNYTLTFPAVTDTLMTIGTNQTLTGVITFPASGIKLTGSSTGVTTFTSGNSSSTSYTLTFPAVTDTLATIGASQTFTGANTFSTNTNTFTQEVDIIKASGSGAKSLVITGDLAPTGESSEFIWGLFEPGETIAFQTTPQTGFLAINHIGQMTVSNPSAGTVTNAVTLRISGPPIASSNMVFTNPYSIFVDDGTCTFGNTLGTAQFKISSALVVNSGGAATSAPVFNYLQSPTGTSSTIITGLDFPTQTVAFATTPQTGAYESVHVDRATLTNPSAGTVATAVTLKIAGAPIASTNVTITNTYSLWVSEGVSRFDGNLRLTGSSSGYTALASGNTSASNYTQTLQQLTGTVALVPASPVFGTFAPTGTTVQSLVQLGIGGTMSITPLVTGDIMFTVDGQVKNSTTADGISWVISYGTGGAPSNGTAATGSTVGKTNTFTDLTGLTSNGVPFSKTVIVPNLTVGTAYWFDVQFEAVTGGTASIINVDACLTELPS